MGLVRHLLNAAESAGSIGTLGAFDGLGRPVQAVVGGRPAGLARYRALETDFAPLVESVRGRGGSINSPHDRLPARALHPSSTVRTTDRSTHTTRLALIGGLWWYLRRRSRLAAAIHASSLR
mgnify:CR=1 FL=1